MNKEGKWKMNRAGLLNFWYYADEIFEFSDGKLLLRGSNGSGKSVTMQSILPVLLDGKTSSDRLDPFGSRARKMEDYLLGEKEIVNRDERTGYLFLEYKREDTNQYITTGIGLQARRHKQLNFWGFVITDNRRIDKDLFLYEMEYNAGEKQQIPLSRKQLENRIGTGGHVVRTRGEYRDLVNKHIFGFETSEAYEDLIKLLIQLRSPKLSKDFRPTVIYEILEAALPPLTDEDLRHLSDTIEHMDQTKQQIEQLNREQEALDKVVQQYDHYNAYRLVDAAAHYVAMQKRVRVETEIIESKLAEKALLKDESASLRGRNQVLEQELAVMEAKKLRLEKHKVWNLAEEREREAYVLTEITKDLDRKEASLTEKKRQELTAKDAVDQQASELATNEAVIDDLFIDLENDATLASYPNHSLNAADFIRNKQVDHDFSLWEKETEEHYETLDRVSKQLREYEDTKGQMTVLDEQIGKTHLWIDQTKQEEKDWRNIFEADKQGKLAEIHRWVEAYPFFTVGEAVLQQTSRELNDLYTELRYETIRQPYVHVNHDFQVQGNKKLGLIESEIALLDEHAADKEGELTEWKDKRDPEPPNQRAETQAARRKLADAGHAFIPLYEAVEFQAHVPEAVQNQIEAALLDAGLLSALITSERTPITHDRIIQSRPNMMAHTLSEYLMPDVALTDEVSAIYVEEVLQSILVDGDGEDSLATIREDGRYALGLIKGHAVAVERVRFIGRNARKRYREEQIKLLTAEIEVLAMEKQKLENEKQAIGEQMQIADAALARFPVDRDLEEAYQHVKEKQFEVDMLQRKSQEQALEMEEIKDVYQQLKNSLGAVTRTLDIEITHVAYEAAKEVIRRYEKDFSRLKTMHLTYRNNQKNIEQYRLRLEELYVDMDDLRGELNVLQDKVARIKRNLTEIDKQLKEHGATDIKRQIEEVQATLRALQKELESNRYVLPTKEAAMDTLKNALLDYEDKLMFSKQLRQSWLDVFVQEINYGFVALPEGVESRESIAKWAMKEYAKLLNKQDQTNSESRLTSIFYEQQTNLMEYRMTDTQTPIPSYEWMQGEWTDEQGTLIGDWQNKASRRLIELEFQGKRVSPYYVQEVVEKDRFHQQTMLNDQDRQLYEEILFHSIGRKLRSRINRAQQWTEKMNKLMENSDSSSGLTFSIQWKPRTAETEVELDTRELVRLLRHDPALLKEADLNQVIDHFRSKIERARELIEIKGEGNTLLQVLKEVLDYRYWFSFVLSYRREGETKRELTNNAFYRFSGGEKAMAMYIPLFTACYSRYSEAEASAPYIISLDEAFAGVDEENISVMFRIVEELGFDYMMNSQVLWGDYNTISSLSIYELLRPKNADFVTVVPYYWDGSTRQLRDQGMDSE